MSVKLPIFGGLYHCFHGLVAVEMRLGIRRILDLACLDLTGTSISGSTSADHVPFSCAITRFSRRYIPTSRRVLSDKPIAAATAAAAAAAEDTDWMWMHAWSPPLTDVARGATFLLSSCPAFFDTLSTFKVKTPPKIPSRPVSLYRLVILCQRLRFVLTIFGAI